MQWTLCFWMLCNGRIVLDTLCMNAMHSYGMIYFTLLLICVHDNDQNNTVAHVTPWSQAVIPDGEKIYLVGLFTLEV